MKTDIIGIALAGGKSSRMGFDKTLANFHGKPQLDHVVDLLSAVCADVYVSKRENPSNDPAIIKDHFNHLSAPLNPILTALDTFRGKSILLMAIDLPFIGSSSLNRLLDGRDPKKIATCFASQSKSIPEPLIAIWEPTALEGLKEFASANPMSGPTKFLQESQVKLIYPMDELELFNVNDREEYDQALSFIRSSYDQSSS